MILRSFLLLERVITVLLHHLKELNDDFARRSDQDLALASFFSIVLNIRLPQECVTYDIVETVAQY